MNKLTYYELTPEEVAHLETIGQPDPEKEALMAEVTRLAVIAEDKQSVINLLNDHITLLSKDLADCKSGTVVTPPPVEPPATTPDLLFAGNFDTAEISRSRIPGWETGLQKIDGFRVQQFSFNSADETFGYAKAVQDPISGKRVMEIADINDDPAISGTARVSWGIGLDKPMEVIHFAYKMKISEDWEILNSHDDAINWLIILEYWQPAGPVPPMGTTSDGSARWNFNIIKEKGGKLYWMWNTEYMQGETPTGPHKRFDDMYPKQVNKTEPIPFGKWVTLDIYFNRNGKTKITIDGRILFDFVGQNQYPGYPDLYVGNSPRTIQPFKIYTDDAVLDWVKSKGKKLSIQYNDFKWFKS